MNIVIIEKNENIIEKHVKSDLEKLYTVCGYRSNKDFQKLNEWEFDTNIYQLYGKKTGKSENENKYKFPNEKNAMDKTLDKYYGNLCILKKNGSITLDEWNMFYMSFTSKYEIREQEVELDEIKPVYDKKYIEEELTYEEYEEEL